MSDINECANDFLNGCNQICTNTIGSFLCECNSGYELGDDLMTCSGLYNNIMSHLSTFVIIVFPDKQKMFTYIKKCTSIIHNYFFLQILMSVLLVSLIILQMAPVKAVQPMDP